MSLLCPSCLDMFVGALVVFNDRCRGPDSGAAAAVSSQSRRFSPGAVVRFPVAVHMIVDVPVVLMQVPLVQTVQDTVWRFHRCGGSARWDVAVFLQRQFHLSPLAVEGASVSFIIMVFEVCGGGSFFGSCTSGAGPGSCGP